MNDYEYPDIGTIDGLINIDPDFDLASLASDFDNVKETDINLFGSSSFDDDFFDEGDV